MVQEHDDVPIEDPDERTWLCNKWRADFRKNELTYEQQGKSDNAQNSMFNSYLKNKFGGKRFIFAVWEMGITWGATEEMFTKDARGATEHVYKSLLQWSYNMSQAMENTKEPTPPWKQHDDAAATLVRVASQRMNGDTAPTKVGTQSATNTCRASMQRSEIIKAREIKATKKVLRARSRKGRREREASIRCRRKSRGG